MVATFVTTYKRMKLHGKENEKWKWQRRREKKEEENKK